MCSDSHKSFGIILLGDWQWVIVFLSQSHTQTLHNRMELKCGNTQIYFEMWLGRMSSEWGGYKYTTQYFFMKTAERQH